MKHIAQIQKEFFKAGALFPSQEALNLYLKKHPDADRSKHRVVKSIKGKSKNRLEFVNYAELKKNFDVLKNKLGDDVYREPDDEKHIHFVNNKALKDAQKILKDKKLDWSVSNTYTD